MPNTKLTLEILKNRVDSEYAALSDINSLLVEKEKTGTPEEINDIKLSQKYTLGRWGALQDLIEEFAQDDSDKELIAVNSPEKNRQIVIRVSEEGAAAIKKLANDNNMTISNLVRSALNLYAKYYDGGAEGKENEDNGE